MAWSDPSNFGNPHGSLLDIPEIFLSVFEEGIIRIPEPPKKQARISGLDITCVVFISFVAIAMLFLLCVLFVR